MGKDSLKRSYTIPCSSAFRQSVTELARRRGVNVADLARSVVLMMPREVVAAFADSGEPGRDDRETVVLKSGAAKGRPWRRKPRLQVRMAPGLDVSFIRRALGLTLSMDRGEMGVRLDAPRAAKKGPPPAKTPRERRAAASEMNLVREAQEEMDRLQAIVSVLSFEPLSGGVKSRVDALHILGFAPASTPSQGAMRARFRMLATIHHPDSRYGNHQRMSQLNAAMEMLRRGAA